MKFHHWDWLDHGKGELQCTECGINTVGVPPHKMDFTGTTCPGPGKNKRQADGLYEFYVSQYASMPSPSLAGPAHIKMEWDKKACTCPMGGPDGLLARGCSCGGI